jgi:hypothetical protein
MKKLLLILLVFLTLQIQAQQFRRDTRWIKLGMYTGSILMDAAGDALNDSNHKGWGHFANAASVGVLVTIPFVTENERTFKGFLLGAGSYTFLRFGLFDYTYNSVRNLPLNYIGGTSFYDKAMQKLNPPETYLARVASLCVGVSLTLKYGK